MKRFALAIVVALGPLALAACASVPAASASPTAGIGQQATAGPLRITPLKVLEDSRCPINARCVWAGRLILRTAIRGPNLRQTRDLTLGEPQAIAGGKLSLVAGEPGKLAGAEGNPPASRFTFEYGVAR